MWGPDGFSRTARTRANVGTVHFSPMAAPTPGSVNNAGRLHAWASAPSATTNYKLGTNHHGTPEPICKGHALTRPRCNARGSDHLRPHHARRLKPDRRCQLNGVFFQKWRLRQPSWAGPTLFFPLWRRHPRQLPINAAAHAEHHRPQRPSNFNSGTVTTRPLGRLARKRSTPIRAGQVRFTYGTATPSLSPTSMWPTWVCRLRLHPEQHQPVQERRHSTYGLAHLRSVNKSAVTRLGVSALRRHPTTTGRGSTTAILKLSAKPSLTSLLGTHTAIYGHLRCPAGQLRPSRAFRSTARLPTVTHSPRPRGLPGAPAASSIPAPISTATTTPSGAACRNVLLFPLYVAPAIVTVPKASSRWFWSRRDETPVFTLTGGIFSRDARPAIPTGLPSSILTWFPCPITQQAKIGSFLVARRRGPPPGGLQAAHLVQDRNNLPGSS